MKRKLSLLTAVMTALVLVLSGCGEEDAAPASAPETAVNDPLSELKPAAVPTDSSRVMQIERSESLPGPIRETSEVPTGSAVSIAEPPVLETKDPTPTPTPTPDPSSEDQKDPNKTGNGTPLVFSVGDSTYVALGSFDPTMEAEILTAINAYRVRGNLPPLEANMSLEFCADTRSREATLCFNHTRPNGSLWYTVAAAYYKAELLAKDYGTAQDTVDAWMSTATGRQYLLSPDLLSIGISVFKHDGRNFIVAGLGD
ncbi:MAG: CAP domain-containing protein [Lachnospiraceae bacterium]|nr:CAP domain-containing protein [Lachnospiraceae bacterium]